MLRRLRPADTKLLDAARGQDAGSTDAKRGQPAGELRAGRGQLRRWTRGALGRPRVDAVLSYFLAALYVQNLGVPNSRFEEKANELRQRYLVWLEVRKLKTHPLLLVPRWTGFSIKTRDHIVIVESVISYLDTIDASATDLRTAYEVLSRGCEVKHRLQWKAVVCIFDQAFCAKAMEIFSQHKSLFEGLVIMMGRFHLLMMLLGVIGTRFGDAGLRELAVQSEVVTEGSIEKVLMGKQYNRCAPSQVDIRSADETSSEKV